MAHVCNAMEGMSAYESDGNERQRESNTSAQQLTSNYLDQVVYLCLSLPAQICHL